MKKRFLLGVVLIFACVCMSGCGNTDNDSKEETIIYETTADVTHDGTVCLSHKDGYDYLLFSSMNEGQGYAYYSYNAVYISDEDGIVTADRGETSFAVGEGPYIDPGKS